MRSKVHKAAAETSETFRQLRALHAVIGDTCRCTWAEYRAEMTGLYGLNGQVIDALARLGHFHFNNGSVRFAGAAA